MLPALDRVTIRDHCLSIRLSHFMVVRLFYQSDLSWHESSSNTLGINKQIRRIVVPRLATTLTLKKVNVKVKVTAWCQLKGLVNRIMHAKYQCSIINTSEDMRQVKVFVTDRQRDGRMSFNVPRFREITHNMNAYCGLRSHLAIFQLHKDVTQSTKSPNLTCFWAPKSLATRVLLHGKPTRHRSRCPKMS